MNDIMAQIMGEAEASIPTSHRWVNHSGKDGRYRLGGLKEEEAEDNPMAERKKFEAIILYNPADPGQALWPDGKLFQGKEPLCQSERSIDPFDTARVARLAAVDATVLKQMGHTGKCSTCDVRNQGVCKPRLVAYILDLGHKRELDEKNAEIEKWNAAHPDEEPKPFHEYNFTKLDAKGPQSVYNFRACYNDLVKRAKKEGKDLASYVVRFSSAEGANSTHKVKFEIVGEAKEDLHGLATVLAGEAWKAAQTIRQPAPALPAAGNTQRALPPAAAQGAFDEEVIDIEDVF